MEIVITVINFLFLLTLTIIGWFLKDLPNMLRELKVESLKSKNERELQIESYFREISGSDLNAILDSWTNLIDTLSEDNTTSSNKKNGKKQLTKNQAELEQQKQADAQTLHIKKLTADTFMYGSDRTTKILALMQQHNYQHNEKTKQQAEPELNYDVMVYISLIIASLKEDFTGYKIDPLDFLRLRLTDFSDQKISKILIESQNNILKELRDNGYDWY